MRQCRQTCCLNLTRLHQLFCLKISTLFRRLRTEKVAPSGQLRLRHNVLYRQPHAYCL